jgi:hypothetical protein
VLGLLVLALGGSTPARAGQGDSPGLPNGDFGLGLAGWTQWASDGSEPFAVAAAPRASGWSATCDLAPGQSARLELRVPIAPGQVVESAPEPGRPGDKVEFGVWVWPGPTLSGGALWVSLEAFDGSAGTLVAESARLEALELPPERWTFLATAALPVLDARVPSGSLELRYRIHCEAQGRVWFGTAVAGPFEYSECELLASSFEDWDPGLGPWEVSGDVRAGPTADTADGYFGSGFALLAGGLESRLSQTISLGGEPSVGAPRVAPGRYVEAGAWLHLDQVVPLPAGPSPSIWCELRVYGISAVSGGATLLAQGRWYPVAQQAEDWVFLQTTPLGALGPADTRLRLELSRSFAADLVVDFVQLGEQHGIDGNPRRRVGCSYVGRYRSPHFSGASTSPATAQGLWRNWCWLGAPACNSAFSGFQHNPDCASSVACVRANGRRDVAVSTLGGEDQLPLVGAYDARDPEVLRYHRDLARAAGIDHFIYDYQGHKLALQTLQQGGEPLNEQSFEALVEVADEPGSDLKLAVMYEPKVHFLGWVAGEPQKVDKVAGIIEDLVHLGRSLAGRRCALRRDGRLVVFLFRNQTCDPTGTQCLDEADWQGIHQAVLAESGHDLFLIGDVAPAADSALQGFTRWQLVTRGILAYRNYQDAELGAPTLPLPRLEILAAHVEALGESVRDWTRAADAERVGVLTVWPGFDDSGVAGWGQANLVGEDGSPLCVRVAHDFEGAFYATTAAGALAAGSDWIQIATWNDWNEATSIEPAWHPEYLGASLLGQEAPPAVEQHVFGRLEETRQWIGAFKGGATAAPAFRRIANDYLSRAQRLPGVALYD